jgi:hypothetical protein
MSMALLGGNAPHVHFPNVASQNFEMPRNSRLGQSFPPSQVFESVAHRLLGQSNVEALFPLSVSSPMDN